MIIKILAVKENSLVVEIPFITKPTKGYKQSGYVEVEFFEQ